MTAGAQSGVGLRAGAALWLAAFVASAAVGTHGVAYWDAGDYVRHALEGSPSGLLLGRPLFLAVSRGILALGVDPHWAEPVLRWFWSAVSALGAPAMAALALALGLSRASALAAGAMLAFSPSFAHTSHHVLTDGPAVVLSIAALIAAARGKAIAAGLTIAAAIATRETAAVHLIAIALLLPAGLALATAALAIIAIVWFFPPIGLDFWFGAMSRSAQDHAFDFLNVAIALGWVVAAGPVPVAIGLGKTREMIARTDRVRLVAVPSLVATVLLLFYPDGSFSPRYVLATVPFAFFFSAAPWLASYPRLTAALLILPLSFTPRIGEASREVAARGRVVMARTAALPAGAVVVPGHYCPHVQLAATIEPRRDITLMCPGWGWPSDPAAALDAALASGRDVAIDLAEEAWLSREQPLREVVSRWAATRESRPVEGWTVVRSKR